MIDDLVAQIEARFAELEDELSDPEVIGDRERFTAASRAYRELEPAARLATEYRRAADDLEGPANCSPRTATIPSCGRCSSPRGSGCERSRKRSGWRWSSATPTTTRT